MCTRKYNNFVKASSPVGASEKESFTLSLSGEEAQRIYLEEVNEISHKTTVPSTNTEAHLNVSKRKHNLEEKEKILTVKDLFVAIQANDVETVKRILQDCPEKVHVLDEFGWSLLMIACQANSSETVKVLLDFGIDTSVRDKAGNSAQSLIIKNKYYHLATILLDNRPGIDDSMPNINKKNCKRKERFNCETCNNVFPDREKHLSSTLHNMNASRNKKNPTCYRIPESNRGFQIMLKTGWDKDTGLGVNGTGIMYPLKPLQKKDKKGLGSEKHKLTVKEECISQRQINRKLQQKDDERKRHMEINFRREFY